MALRLCATRVIGGVFEVAIPAVSANTAMLAPAPDLACTRMTGAECVVVRYPVAESIDTDCAGLSIGEPYESLVMIAL